MFDSVLDEFGNAETAVTVYADGEPSLASWFETHNVPVESRSLAPSGPEPFLAIEKRGEFAGALPLEDVDDLLTPPLSRPEDTDAVSEGYRALFDALDRTVYQALDCRQLLTVSREIEDRVYRTGTGELHVCFQRFSAFEAQLPRYRRLAGDTAVDIHVYGVPDWTPPEIPGITYHEAAGELERYWLLAYDGGDHPCGLFGHESDDGYTGYWADDREFVDAILDELPTDADG
ncbi:DICT sensory domain-containing protein [Haloarcula laminariae]|uniref:DICT sensory domain-containing protein n=1 Tax=Haloarcula laminariae TaxID=2961577 RepID=UPI0021C94824|nr:DICT sensory domain-containing protein [Halomicroarcula laminariae]